jgi:hypothetical protein
MQLEDIMLSDVIRNLERQILQVFSHMWKIDPKDKPLHTTK